MPNPNGPYPGRQLFVGMTNDGRMAIAYLVTGRSPQSRERKATHRENSIIIGPMGNQPYDPLRHYTAVKYDDTTGIVTVSNGIQTEAIYETYRLVHNIGSDPAKDYMEKLLDGAGSEPDSLNTPRIVGVVTSHDKTSIYFIGIKWLNTPAKVTQVKPAPGILIGISTYSGNLENPKPFESASALPQLKFGGKDAKELADYLFNLSLATYNGDDIRVCTVGGIYSAGKWAIAMVNKHQE